ncbi:MAG TPA: hypothetical protein PLM61_13970 [Thermoanaerobaculales bacterium]|nr:hypothetical protein [Thermoanaerobaculales bacterium]
MTTSIRGQLVRALVGSAVTLMLVLPAAAQDCPQLLGRWPYGTASAVAVAGSLAFVDSGTVLLVLDVSDPESPQLLGSVTLPELVEAIAAAGSHVYVANGMSGLRIIDVSNPSAPVEVGVSDVTNELALDVAVAGSRAYVAYATLGLRVIDVSVPSQPAVVGAVDTPGTAMGVAVAGSHAFVADGGSGLRVISIANPAAPVEVGAIDTPGSALDVAVSGSHALVADYYAGLRVISVANPAAPAEVGSLSTPSSTTAVAVAGNVAFVARQYYGVQLVDVSDPAAPAGRGRLRTYGSDLDVTVSSGLAYVTADWEGMIIGEFSDPAAPTIVGTYRTAGGSDSVAIAGSLAYVGTFLPGVRVMDVSTPSAPVDVSWLEVGDTPLEIVISGSHAFIAELEAGFEVLDLSNPLEPVSVAVVDTPGWARGVALAGTRAYVADDSAGLVVMDISSPAAPVQVGAVDTPGLAYGVAVAGGYAFVADESAGLTVVDVRVPTAPSVVTTLGTAGSAWGVTISGNYAYVASAGGLHIIDISAPTAPHQVGSLAGWAEDVDVAGSLAYVAGDFRRVVVAVDVSDPSQPVEVGAHGTLGRTRDLALADGIVVVADGDAGVAVFGDCEGWTPESPISYIPAAAVAAGAQGAFFQTDLEVNNTGDDEAQVTVQWLPRGEDNSEPVGSNVIELGAGESERFENVLTELFGLEPDSVGALRLVASSGSVIGMSRTYNIPGGKTAGTFGQGLPAIRAAEMISGTEPRRIIFLSEDPDSRANVGCVNGTAQDVQISIAMHNARGALLDTRTMALGPYSNNQINRIFRDFQPVRGYVDVSAGSEDALYYCYGSMLDNQTSDPTTLLPQVPSDDTTFIPAAALAAGLEGAFFETDVDLNNAGATTLTYRLRWLPRGVDNSDPVESQQFSLAAGAGVRYANVLDSVFGLDPDRVGALAVEASSSELLAMSRTYNLPSAKVAGTFGQELPGIPADRMIRSGVTKRIIFMNENADVRSNVGCVNGSDEAAVVSLELHDAEGELLEIKTMSLPPYSNNQVTRVFRNHMPVEAGYVDVRATTPGSSFYCYGSVLDNQTSDPTTVLPQ